MEMNARTETPSRIKCRSRRICGLLALLAGCSDVLGFEEGKPYAPDGGHRADSSASGDGADAGSIAEDVSIVDGEPGREVVAEASDEPLSTMDASTECRLSNCPPDGAADAGDGGDGGRNCAIGSECASGFCNVNTHLCVATQCED